MRLFVLSDLHLEKPSPARPYAPETEFDVLVCAGDIFEGEPERGIAAVADLAAGRPAIVVPGNHDRYRRGPGDLRTAEDLVAAMRAAAEQASRVTLLEAGADACIGGVTFIGATLWTDWTLAGLWRPQADPGEAMAQAIAHVTDPATGSREYSGALVAAGAVWHPRAAAAAHRRERAALQRALAGARGSTRVVVTHHAPLTEILEPYRDAPGVPWWIPAFYGSTVLADLPAALRPDVWVSGHFHATHDRRLGGTRCVANPVAAAGYDPRFVVDLSAFPQPSRNETQERGKG